MELSIINEPRVIPRRRFYSIIKRVIDIAICISVFPVAIPIMIICAIVIFVDDRHDSIIFIQERIGKGGRPFRIYKFRTMKSDKNDAQIRAYMRSYVKGEITDDTAGVRVFKPIPASHIFRAGRVMRKTSLDELPQIINVLKGEMSIVGPRPNVPWEVGDYRPWHYERLEVLPGITGLAQVRGRSCIGFNSLVRHDIEYIEKRGLILDFKILWWTLKAIIRANGAM